MFNNSSSDEKSDFDFDVLSLKIMIFLNNEIIALKYIKKL